MATVLSATALLLPTAGNGGSQKFIISLKPWPFLKIAPCYVNRARAGFAAINGAGRLMWQRRLQFASSQEVAETELEQSEERDNEEIEESDNDKIEGGDTGDSEDLDVEKTPVPVLQTLLQAYKEAIAANDEARIADIENHLHSIEDERSALSQQVAVLTEELLVEKERLLRLNADFDNFRKRQERERISLASNVRGEVIESLLPMVDSFERAKSQIKTETEGEEKINNSYQSIYKQFVEIMKALGVSVIETVGKRFDPTLHEAIMREESTEFEEGIIIEEFRRGFKLGDGLLRPAMVKVSAGPGPVKPSEASAVAGEEPETVQDSNASAEEPETVRDTNVPAEEPETVQDTNAPSVSDPPEDES